MPGRLSPKLAKLHELSEKKHLLLQEAVRLHALKVEKPPHLRKGTRAIAANVMAAYKCQTGEDILIGRNTIHRVFNGGQPLHDFNKSKAWLNQEEEETVVDFLIKTANQGFPLMHRRFEDVVNAIVKNCIPNFPGVGKRYTDRFLTRHANQILSYWASSLDQCCAQAVNQHAVLAWFDLFAGLINEHSNEWENMWGADETGVALGVGRMERVLAASARTKDDTG